MALLSGWSISEPPSARQVAGTVVVAGGAWLYFSGGLGATTVGMVAALVGLGANAVAALLGRRVNRQADLSPVVVTTLSMAVGAVVLIAVGGAVEGLPTVSPRAWAIIAWLAVVNTALAFTLWNLSLRRLEAVESAALNNTMLIQIALLAWVFLGESLGVWEMVGILLVSVGTLLARAGGGVGQTRRRD